MGQLKDHTAIARMVTEALPKGMTRKSMSRFEWDVSGRCESPVSVTMTGRPAACWLQRLRYVVIKPRHATSLIVELLTPCRKCRPCLKARMRMWAARAMHEVRESKRTWFATLTLSPEAHYAMQCRAIAHAESRSIPTAELTAEDLFARQSNECEKELTLWLKRIRKELSLSGSMRYLLVRERHKSGLPHWHALIHESGEVPIPYRVLDTWEHGFSKFKLMEDERAAFYVAKYLGKSNDGRVRASIRYGRFNSDHDPSLENSQAQRRREMEATSNVAENESQKSGASVNEMNNAASVLAIKELNDLCDQEAK